MPQETPKASSSQREEKNPFDSLAPPPVGGLENATRGQTHSRGNSGGSLRQLTMSGDQTPGLRTPGGVTSHASVPTTSVSTTGESMHYSEIGKFALRLKTYLSF